MDPHLAGVLAINPKQEIPDTSPDELPLVAPSHLEASDFLCFQKCVFCECILRVVDNSKLLECLHPACGTCIQSQHNDVGALEGASMITCPICKIGSLRDKMIENKMLAELRPITESETDKCKNHMNEVASDWCNTCNKFICKECVKRHRELDLDHVIKSKEERDLAEDKKAIIESQYMCVRHPKEVLKYYCETCMIMTCGDCQLSYHKKHAYKSVEEIAPEARLQLKNRLNNLEYRTKVVIAGLSEIDIKSLKVMERKAELEVMIHEFVREYTNIIKKLGEDLLSNLNAECHKKKVAYDEKKDILNNFSAQAKYTASFVEQALAISSDSSIVFAWQLMEQQLQRALNNKVQIPHPNYSIHMRLVPCSNIEKVRAYLSQLYRLEVDSSVNQTKPATAPVASGSGYQTQAVPYHPSQATPAVPVQSRQQPSWGASWPQQAIQQQPQQQQQQQFHQYPQPIQTHHPSPNSAIQASGAAQVTSSTHPPTPPLLMQQKPPQRTMQQQIISPQQQQMMNYQQAQVQYRDHQARQQASQWLMTQNQSQLKSMLATQTQMKQNANAQMGNVVQNAGMCGRLPQTVVQRASSLPQLTISQAVPSQQRQQIHQQTSFPSWHKPQAEAGYGNMRAPQAIPEHVRVGNVATPSYKIVLNKPAKTPPQPPPAALLTQPTVPPPPLQDAQTSSEFTTDQEFSHIMEALEGLEQSTMGVKESSDKARGDDKLVTSTNQAPTPETPTAQTPTPEPVSTPSASTTHQEGSTEWQKDDPNEDWCAVCMDGGDLVCCDSCPKVFHTTCHIPALAQTPPQDEPWQCLLCRTLPCITGLGEKRAQDLTVQQHTVLERILLELYCQYDQSLHFREPIPPENKTYHEMIKKPMCFDMIRKRLSPDSYNPYKNVRQVLRHIRLVFKNAFLFNEVGSQIHKDAINLEEFLECLLTKYLPDFAHQDVSDSSSEEEDDDTPQSKRYKRIKDG